MDDTWELINHPMSDETGYCIFAWRKGGYLDRR